MTAKITPAGPRPSPAKMLSEMSNKTTLAWIAVALVIHVVVFTATSIPYLRGAFDPSAVQSQSADAEGLPGKPVSPTPSAVPSAAAPAASTAAKPKVPAAEAKAEVTDEAKMLETHKDSPVVKSITETAKPSELPKGPSRNALELDSLESK